MRVFDLTTLYLDGGEGGVNTYLREKAAFLERLFPDVQHAAILPGSSTRIEKLGASTLFKLRSPSMPGNPQHRLLVDFRRIAAILREQAPDVVEVDTSYFLGHVAARALRPRRVPIVGLYHVHLPMLYTRRVANPLRSCWTRMTEPLAWRYAELCARPCQRVIVTSSDMFRRLQGRGFPRLELVPLGVNIDLFRPPPPRRQRLSGVSSERPVVLYVGRLSPEKDLDVLFRAHRILHAECGSRLLVAGDGPLERRTRRFARRHPSVTYVGRCPYGEPLTALYGGADVLAMPGRNESFCLVVLEALACGLPVVAVDQGGPSWLLRPGLGLLARPGDPLHFAQQLKAALARSRDGGPERRSYVEENFTWERSFERLLGIYDSVISSRLAGQTA
jgi:alpha-1,6-mannosyltransferase